MTQAEKRDLVFQLRNEVRDVKDCFNRYAFQGSALAVAVAGFILGEHQHPAVGLVALPAVLVLMLICRVGIFKYTTANRNLGYELHLDRLKKYAQIYKSKHTSDRVATLEDMGWEEALRAWRVVQASIFAKIYTIPQIKADCSSIWPNFLDPGLYRLKGKARDEDSKPRDLRSTLRTSPYHDGPYAWWNQKKLTEHYEGEVMTSHFHTGNFLKSVLTALNIMQWWLFGLLCWSGIDWLRLQRFSWLYASVVLAGVAVIGLFILCRQIRITRRRLILEEEVGSIHSCAITWGAVAIVHFAAAEDTPFPYYDYTVRLAMLCTYFEPTELPILVLKDIREDKLFFKPAVYSKNAFGDPLLVDRRVAKLSFNGSDRRIAA